MERSPIETYELSPDGRKAIETYRNLEQAMERVTELLCSRIDVQPFRILRRDRPRPPRYWVHRLIDRRVDADDVRCPPSRECAYDYEGAVSGELGHDPRRRRSGPYVRDPC